jgi:hypothetical protein
VPHVPCSLRFRVLCDSLSYTDILLVTPAANDEALNAFPNVYTISKFVLTFTLVDRLCGLVVRVPGYRTEMYCDSCEVRTEFLYVI